MNIDLHSHFFPIEALGRPGKYQDRAPKIQLEKGKLTVACSGATRSHLSEGAYDAAARVKALNEMRIDLQALSPSPILLFYREEPAAASYFSRLQNEAIQNVVEKHPDRFVGFGSAPLQNVDEAIAIAREAKNIGLKGLEIGTAVGERPLDDPAFEPFFDAVQGLDLLLFVHPVEDGLKMQDPLTAMIGSVVHFPFRTTLMIERLILSGLFEKYRNLRLCLSHGGGLLAFNIARFDHAYQQRPELRKLIPQPPSVYLKQLYFDSIVHSVAALEYLKSIVGADRIVIGTDYPMAGMGDFEPVGKIEAAQLSEAERRQLLGDNAARALHL